MLKQVTRVLETFKYITDKEAVAQNFRVLHPDGLNKVGF